MKRKIFLAFFLIFMFGKILYTSMLLVDDFESYAGSKELESTYKPANWQVNVKLNYNDTYGKSLKLEYNSINWGTYVTRTFLTPYNLENYRGILIYLKGDGSNNELRLQIRESSISGNLDGEAWEMQTGISLSYQGYNSYFVKFSDLAVTSGTKKKGVLDLASIKELTILIYKNSDIISGSVYIDNIKFIPNTIEEIYPHNEANIDVPDDIKIFVALKLNPLTYSNYISITNTTDSTKVNGTFSYDIGNNIITFTPSSPFTKYKNYKIFISKDIEISGTENLPISGLDDNATYSFYVTDNLTLNKSGGILQDKETGIIVSVPYNAIYSSESLNLSSYSGTEFSSSPYIFNRGIKINVNNIINPIILMLYEKYFIAKNPSYLSKSLSFYFYQNGWNEIKGSSKNGFISAGIIQPGIYGIGESGSKEKDIIENIKLSSNPFTPNNDGKNDFVKIYFDLNRDSLVNISVYDINGYKVKDILVDTKLSSGKYFYQWDGKNLANNYVKPGFYIYRISVVYEDSGIQKEIIKRGVISVLY